MVQNWRADASDPAPWSSAGVQMLLLCLDEPAAGLNPSESEDLNRLLLGIRSAGVTLLLIEHDMKVVMEISDHIIVLEHGRKIADGPPGPEQSARHRRLSRDR